MEISKIKSPYSLNQIFSFVSDKRKFKIIKYNIYLNKKLDLSIDDYKECFFFKPFPTFGIISFKIIDTNQTFISFFECFFLFCISIIT